MTTPTTAQDTNPTYIYKLVPHTAAPPLPLPPALPVSQLDESSGFIHFSTAPQVLGTLIHFFTDDPRVYVLRVPYVSVQKDVRWEDPKGEVCGDRPGEGLFPHVYNGLRLGKEEVESVVCWERERTQGEKKGWEELVKEAEAEEWLVY